MDPVVRQLGDTGQHIGALRSADSPLISRSMSNSASMRLTASRATEGGTWLTEFPDRRSTYE